MYDDGTLGLILLICLLVLICFQDKIKKFFLEGDWPSREKKEKEGWFKWGN